MLSISELEGHPKKQIWVVRCDWQNQIQKDRDEMPAAFKAVSVSLKAFDLSENDMTWSNSG